VSEPCCTPARPNSHPRGHPTIHLSKSTQQRSLTPNPSSGFDGILRKRLSQLSLRWSWIPTKGGESYLPFSSCQRPVARFLTPREHARGSPPGYKPSEQALRLLKGVAEATCGRFRQTDAAVQITTAETSRRFEEPVNERRIMPPAPPIVKRPLQHFSCVLRNSLAACSNTPRFATSSSQQQARSQHFLARLGSSSLPTICRRRSKAGPGNSSSLSRLRRAGFTGIVLPVDCTSFSSITWIELRRRRFDWAGVGLARVLARVLARGMTSDLLLSIQLLATEVASPLTNSATDQPRAGYRSSPTSLNARNYRTVVACMDF
jgi:hypothetical protein